jgi:tetratricopeptide (TPR) repeat protein
MDTKILAVLAEKAIEQNNDGEKAEQLLIQAESVSKNCTDYINIADAYYDIFNDTEKAVELLMTAEKASKLCSEYVNLAKIHLRFFQDKPKASQLLAKAGEKAQTGWDFADIANAHIKLLNDRVKAQAMLNQAKHWLLENCVISGASLAYVTYIYLIELQDKKEMQKIIDFYEKGPLNIDTKTLYSIIESYNS